METPKIADKVKFWEEQDRINKELIPRVLKQHELLTAHVEHHTHADPEARAQIKTLEQETAAQMKTLEEGTVSTDTDARRERGGGGALRQASVADRLLH